MTIRPQPEEIETIRQDHLAKRMSGLPSTEILLAEIDAQAAEIERLKVEVQRLEAAIRKIVRPIILRQGEPDAGEGM